MKGLVDGVCADCRSLIRRLSVGHAETVSDRDTKAALLKIAEDWHQTVKPAVTRVIPTTDSIYEIDNVADRLAEYSTQTSKRRKVVVDLRALVRRLERDVKLPLVRSVQSEQDTGSISQLINADHFDNPRKYFVETVRQINITYTMLCPDGSALLLRKMVEFMLLDFYQIKGRLGEITDSGGQIKQLKTVINHFIGSSGTNPNEVLRNFLQDARVFGGTAAHNARVTMLPADIDRIAPTVEMALRELHTIVYQAK